MSTLKSNNKPLLTIAIPTFNRGQILDVSLTKLLNQVHNYHDDVEIILSNNASEDNTQEVINKHINKNPSLNITSFSQQTNTGYYGNFKKCRELSNGIYFWLLSDNEHLRSNTLSLLINHIKASKLSAGVYYFDNSDINEGFKFTDKTFTDLIHESKAHRLTLISAVIFLNNKRYDDYIEKIYYGNSFLGFLYLISALRVSDKIVQISGKVFDSAPCSVYFNIFNSWTKDISECISYMSEHSILNDSVRDTFITGYLKKIIYNHVFIYKLKGQLHNKSYGKLDGIRLKLDEYYYSNSYYKKYIRRLFSTPNFILWLKYHPRKLIKKIYKLITKNRLIILVFGNF